MSTTLRVLQAEDSEDDARLVLRELRKAGYEPDSKRVQTAADFSAALDAGEWDIIISDYRMPDFNAPEALRIYQKKNIDIPFIVVSGTIGEELAVELMRAGAHDYVMKDNLARLGVDIERELRDAQSRRDGRKAEEAVRARDERLRLVLENTSDVIVTLSPAGEIQYISPQVARYGFTEADIGSGAILKAIEKRDYERMGSDIREAIAGGKAFSFDFSMETPVMGTCFFEAVGSYLWKDQQIEQVIIVLRDVTERNRIAEERRAQQVQETRSELTTFMVSALPVFGAMIPPEVRTLLVSKFAERFEANVWPDFSKSMNEMTDGSTDPKIVFESYISWFTGYLANIGIPAKCQGGNGRNRLVFSDCPWNEISKDNPVFCLICRTMVMRSFAWTGLQGEPSHNCSLAGGAGVCIFDFQ